MYGKPAKSDPYLKVKLGDFKFNDRKHAVDDVTDVDFYKVCSPHLLKYLLFLLIYILYIDYITSYLPFSVVFT